MTITASNQKQENKIKYTAYVIKCIKTMQHNTNNHDISSIIFHEGITVYFKENFAFYQLFLFFDKTFYKSIF